MQKADICHWHSTEVQLVLANVIRCAFQVSDIIEMEDSPCSVAFDRALALCNAKALVDLHRGSKR